MENALPHALGPEKAILSILIQDHKCFYPLFIELGMSFDMFYLSSHIKLGAVISELASGNKSCDLTTLVQVLLDKGWLDDVGGPAAVTEVYSYSPSNQGFDGFCELVKTKYIARRIYQLSCKIQNETIDVKEEVQQFLGDAGKELNELESLLYPKSDSTVKSSIQSVIDDFQTIIQKDDLSGVFGVSTGFKKFDEMTLGLKAGGLYIIGARPSVGKTSYICNMIHNICVKDKKPVLFCSLEMPKKSILNRMIYSTAALPFHKIALRTNNGASRYIPTKAEMIRFSSSAKSYASAPLYIEDKSGMTIEEIRSHARAHKRQYGIEAIFIDYLQLVRCYGKMAQQSKNNEVSEISSGLKSIAKELKIPVVCLSQLNRQAGENRPKMKDLRDSGSIEQDADLIGLLHRYDYEGKEGREGEAEINISKNREGPTEIIEMIWNAELTEFKEKII